MKLFLKIVFWLLIISSVPNISVGQEDTLITNTDTLGRDKQKTEKRHRFFTRKSKNDSTQISNSSQSNQDQSDTLKGNGAINQTTKNAKSGKKLSGEARRKQKVQKKYNRKLIRLKKKCTLSPDEKMAMNKSKGMKLSPGEKKLCRRAEKKMDKYDKKKKIYEQKRHFKIQEKKTRKMIRSTKKNSERDRKNHKKFNINNGIFSNEK